MVLTVPPREAISSLADACERAIRLQLQIFLQVFDGAGRRHDFAARVRRSFGREIQTVLIVGVGVVGICRDRLLELIAGGFVLRAVDQQRSHVVVVLPGARGIELCRLIQIRLGLVDFFVFGQSQREVVVIAPRRPASSSIAFR